MPDGCPHDSKLQRIAVYYREFGGYVGRVLRRCGVREDELEDAVQETFLVAYRRIDDFQGRATVRTWLYAIAIRVASTMRRSRSREDARRTRAGAEVMGSGAPDPELAVCTHQAQAVLDTLLDELDEPKRVVFVLSELEGLRIPEVARILGINVNTVHSRLRLARQRFDAALQRHHAQEAGRRSRARWLRQARREEPAWTDHARRQSWAALAFRLEHDPLPRSVGWEALALPTSGGVTSWTTWMAGGLATLGLGAAIGLTAAEAPRHEVTPPSAPTADAARDRSRRAAAPPSEHVYPAWSSTPEDENAPPSRNLTASPPPTDAKFAVTATPSGPVPHSRSEPTVAGPSKTERSGAGPGSEEARPHDAGPAGAGPDDTAGPAGGDRKDTAGPQGTRPGEVSPEMLAHETALLQRARRALQQGAPSAALAALDEHAARHPQGMLARERDSSRIHALCMAGRRESAVALAARLSSTSPSSRWDRVLAARCGQPSTSPLGD